MLNLSVEVAMYKNKTKQTLLLGAGKMPLLVHSLSNEKQVHK